MIQSMIESTKRKLLLEQKVRQAAQSLNRLENAANKRQRIGSEHSASIHLVTAQKKCDEINAELWRLTTLAMDIERKLAHHNAAVLGLGMSILEKRTMQSGHTDEFGEGHLYASNESMEDRHISRLSLSDRRVSLPVAAPPVDLTEAQSRLTQVISNIATTTKSPPPQFAVDTPLLEYISTLEHNIHHLTQSHSLTVSNLQASMSESQRMIDQLRLRERDQSSAIADVTARNDDLERRLRQTEREFDRVQNELDEADDLVESLRSEVGKIKEEARISEAAAQGRETESLKLEKTLRQSESEQFNAELASKEAQIAEMLREQEELREQVGRHQRNAESWLSQQSAKARQHDSLIANLEAQLVALKSENATLKSERDEILGSRQQRAEEARLQRELEEQREKFARTAQSQESLNAELDELKQRNSQLVKDLQFAKSEKESREDLLSRQILALEEQIEMKAATSASPISPVSMTGGESGSSRERELEARCEELQSELSSILDDFERLTSQFIDHESFRTTLEAQVDGLRAQCHNLQTELAEERVKMLGRNAPAVGDASPHSGIETMSTVTLRKEFRKIVAELRAEHIAALKVLTDFEMLG